MVRLVALARLRARCLGSIGEGQTQGLVVVAHAGDARERLARRAPCAAGAAVWSRVDPRARPAPPSSRGGAALKVAPWLGSVAAVHWGDHFNVGREEEGL